LEIRIGTQCRLIHKKQRVLTQPPKHILVAPDQRPERIDRLKSMIGELAGPVSRPLFVDMTMAALKRHRGRKKYDVTMPRH